MSVANVRDTVALTEAPATRTKFERIIDALRSAGFNEADRHVELAIFSEYSGVRQKPAS